MQVPPTTQNFIEGQLFFILMVNNDISEDGAARPITTKSQSLLPFLKIKRSMKIKKEAESATKYGCAPEQRKIKEYLRLGVINIDKPRGPTSHQVSDYVKRIMHSQKAGHSGSLDPHVTGVLPVALDDATKSLTSLLTSGKEYVCIMHLHKPVAEAQLREAISRFIGKINQLPPKKSAVKREMREREIYYLDVLEIDGQDVLFRVGCQAGTYIRKLCHDLGAFLRVGAHMSELRRTRAGPFDESSLCTLHDLADAQHYLIDQKDELRIRKLVIPVEKAVSHLGKIMISDDVIFTVTHGATLHVPGVAQYETGIKRGDPVALFSLKGELVALATAFMSSEELWKTGRGVVARTLRVMMPENAYPRMI